MLISIIFAMNANRIIGNNGELPWHLPSDLKRFKEITTGRPVIMGRKTFDSIIARNGKPLPGRMNVVITRNPNRFSKDHGATVLDEIFFYTSLEQALHNIGELYPEVFIIGGAEIYAQALEVADRMYFTQVSGNFEGDTKFPQYNMNDWETVHDELVATDTHPYAFSILERVRRVAASASTTGENLVNPTFAKSEGYGKTIADILAQGICPFCPEHFLWHPWPILHRVGNWFITRSGWPYENAEHHFLIIGKNHLIAGTQMTIRDEICVRQLTSWAVNTFGLAGWGSVARSGDTNLTGATVQHLHFHLIQPKRGPDGKALVVWFPIG